MDHADHVGLIRAAVEATPVVNGIWADVGAGSGAFTEALADALGPAGRIVAIDRDAGGLERASAAVARRVPGFEIESLVADFTEPLDLPALDGLVAANSLHFVRRERQVGVVSELAAHLRPGGTFLVVEYDADRGNPWVPHPFSERSWSNLAADAGLVDVRHLGRVPSRFLGAIYSTSARRPG
jgi:ubiquinone/menaquinone biosynthesis C-methylase UbiE